MVVLMASVSSASRSRFFRAPLEVSNLAQGGPRLHTFGPDGCLSRDDAQAERLVELIDVHLLDVVAGYCHEPHILGPGGPAGGCCGVVGEVVSLTHGTFPNVAMASTVT